MGMAITMAITRMGIIEPTRTMAITGDPGTTGITTDTTDITDIESTATIGTIITIGTNLA